MGISHYYPSDSDSIHYRIVNLHHSEELGYDYDNPNYAEDEAYFHQSMTNHLIRTIQSKLSVVAPTGYIEQEYRDNALVIYRTPLLEVTITDNQVLWAIVVRPRSDFDGDRESNLAPKHIDRVAKCLFDHIAANFDELYVPSGAYTGGLWNGDINNC